MVGDCMLRKREEKKEKVKDEAYYVAKWEEVKVKTKDISFVSRGTGEEEGTYQIWSSRPDDEEMRNPLMEQCMQSSKKGKRMKRMFLEDALFQPQLTSLL